MNWLFNNWTSIFLLFLLFIFFLQLLEVDRKRVELAAALNVTLNSHLTALANANSRQNQELISLRARVDRLEHGKMQ